MTKSTVKAFARPHKTRGKKPQVTYYVGEVIELRKPASVDYIRLVKLVREAVGVGLREAKDMIDCGTTIRVEYPELAAEIKKIVEA